MQKHPDKKITLKEAMLEIVFFTIKAINTPTGRKIPNSLSKSTTPETPLSEKCILKGIKLLL